MIIVLYLFVALLDVFAIFSKIAVKSIWKFMTNVGFIETPVIALIAPTWTQKDEYLSIQMCFSCICDKLSKSAY